MSKKVICELPGRPCGAKARLVLETEGDARDISLMRRDNDIFFVTADLNIVAALVQIEASRAVFAG